MPEQTPWEKVQAIYALVFARKEQDISLEESWPYKNFMSAYAIIRDTHAACSACTTDVDVALLKKKAEKLLPSEFLGGI